MLVGQHALAAADGAAVAARALERLLLAAEGVLRDERSAERAGLARVAHGHRRVGALEAPDQLVGDALVHDQPAQAGAALAGGADGAEDDRAHRQVEVGAGRDDHGVVAAELEQRRPSRAAISGESALPMTVEPVADTSGSRGSSASWRARSAPPITTSSRPSGASPKAAAARRKSAWQASAVSGVRSLGFHTTGSPHTSARAAFQLHTATGKLNASDYADRAERVPGLEHAMAGALGGDRTAEELSREPHGEVADVDHLLHLAEALLGDLAGLERDELSECLLLASQLLAQEADELAAPWCGHVAPDLEGFGGSRDCGIGAGRIGAMQVCEHLAGDGRADLKIAVCEGARSIPRRARMSSMACMWGTSVRAPQPAGRRDRAMTRCAMLGHSADVAQWLERRLAMAKVEGSSPFIRLPERLRGTGLRLRRV